MAGLVSHRVAIVLTLVFGTAAAAAVAVAVATSLSAPPSPSERAEPAPPVVESDAVRRARRALAEGDATAAARALAGAVDGDGDLRAAVARELASGARQAAAGWDLDEALRLLDLARKTGAEPDDLLLAERDLTERLARRKEAEELLAAAAKAREDGDLPAAAAAARRAFDLGAGEILSRQAREFLETAQADQKKVLDREQTLAEAERLLAAGDVRGARTTLEQYARRSGDASLTDRIEDLRRVEEAGGTGTFSPVRSALLFLAAHLGSDGGLHGETWMKVCGEKECAADRVVSTGHDAGLSGLALLAFTAFRALDLREEFAEPAEKVAKSLAGQVLKDGQVRGGHYDAAIAALALLEHGSPASRPAAVRVLDYLQKRAVLSDGGWRYSTRDPGSDTSVTCWVLQALHAARKRELPIDEGVLLRALDFLGRARRTDGHAAYTEYQGGGPPLTAAALLARRLFATDTPDDVAQSLSAALLGALKPFHDAVADPRRRASAPGELLKRWPDEYAWYYVTYALEQTPGPDFDTWRPLVEQALALGQAKEGHLAGSWDPDTFRWGKGQGRPYVAAMNALTLAAVYRHRSEER
ncbi:MAG: terpene cyclase/mutase family protein [Planctomycetes bacterium]|nr:terpene cyclase/mutase family protein [Planctomycetota bacterium]MCU0728096.1 terpene cyclase/mutase family protein [Planctomycetota bacterium]